MTSYPIRIEGPPNQPAGCGPRRPWGRGLALLALLFVGCRGPIAGPDYVQPCSYVRPAWTLGDRPQLQGASPDLCAWWTLLGDEQLNSYIQELTRQNLTLREAGERILVARARVGVARGELFPQTQTLNGSYSKSRISANTANFFGFPGVFDPDLNVENWQLGLSTAWELDFWGRFRRAVEAADAELGATVAAYHEARVLLVAEGARAYVDMRTFERRHALAQDNAAILAKTLELVKQKEAAGSATAIDVAQAESNLRQTEALAPTFDTLRRQASNRLCVLLGRPPEDLATSCGCGVGIPRAPHTVAIGIPADLLRQRPDVHAAERRLAAQSARIGVAEAEFYPHIGLTASIGYQAEDLSKLVRPTSSVGVISPYFSWNILNYCRIRNNVEAEKATFRALAWAYQSAVLTAQREAEDAQIAFLNGHRRTEALAAAVGASASAAEKAERAYRQGATDYGRVFILQSDLVRQQDQLAEAEAEIATSLIDLYKALGGGWQCCPAGCVAGMNPACDAGAPCASIPRMLPPSEGPVEGPIEPPMDGLPLGAQAAAPLPGEISQHGLHLFSAPVFSPPDAPAFQAPSTPAPPAESAAPRQISQAPPASRRVLR